MPDDPGVELGILNDSQRKKELPGGVEVSRFVTAAVYNLANPRDLGSIEMEVDDDLYHCPGDLGIDQEHS